MKGIKGGKKGIPLVWLKSPITLSKRRIKRTYLLIASKDNIKRIRFSFSRQQDDQYDKSIRTIGKILNDTRSTISAHT
jgi:hypothetical protein